MDEKSLSFLKSLVEEFNCKVILSSSWRDYLTVDLKPVCDTFTLIDGTEKESYGHYLIRKLAEIGITLAGKTGHNNEGDHWSRPTEIWNYIKNNFSEEDNWVILDDEIEMISDCHPDIKSYIVPHFAKSNFYGNGLDEEVYLKAVQILAGGNYGLH